MISIISIVFAVAFGNIEDYSYLPQNVILIQRTGYLLAYEGRTRNACWVYEILTAKSLQTKDAFKCFSFKKDLAIPENIRAELEDYRGSGFHKGHLCPNANLKSDSKAAAESFFLSNISPQVPNFNQGCWRKLEKHVMSLAKEFIVLHVITMPLYLSEKEEKGSFVRYQVLGKNHVAVPTHFSKVIFAEGEKGVSVFAFILPNRPIPKETPISSFRTTLEAVERASGIIFPKLVKNSDLP